MHSCFIGYCYQPVIVVIEAVSQSELSKQRLLYSLSGDDTETGEKSELYAE
jgi:hypothetical protein